MLLQFLISPEDAEQIGQDALNSIAAVYEQILPREAQVDIALISLPEMQAINKAERSLDEPTDVLSFPVYTSKEDMALAPAGPPILLGSIVISPEKAVMYEETLPQLVHHGLVHLMGYDHETDMPSWQAMERPILAQLAHHNLFIPEVPEL